MKETQFWFTLIIVIVIAGLILYVLREVVCWYTKTNDLIALQKEQNEYLRRIADNLAPLNK